MPTTPINRGSWGTVTTNVKVASRLERPFQQSSQSLTSCSPVTSGTSGSHPPWSCPSSTYRLIVATSPASGEGSRSSTTPSVSVPAGAFKIVMSCLRLDPASLLPLPSPDRGLAIAPHRAGTTFPCPAGITCCCLHGPAACLVELHQNRAIMSANQSTRKRRHVNGDGSVYKPQQDSYWVGAGRPRPGRVAASAGRAGRAAA